MQSRELKGGGSGGGTAGTARAHPRPRPPAAPQCSAGSRPCGRRAPGSTPAASPGTHSALAPAVRRLGWGCWAPLLAQAVQTRNCANTVQTRQSESPAEVSCHPPTAALLHKPPAAAPCQPAAQRLAPCTRACAPPASRRGSRRCRSTTPRGRRCRGYVGR